MAVLVLTTAGLAVKLQQALRAVDPDLDVRVWPGTGERAEIDFAVAWKQPPGELGNYPNLKCVASLGAGVDHILADPGLPEGASVVRFVDRSLIRSMTEYVVAGVLFQFRRFGEYLSNQRRREWRREPPRRAADSWIAILGVGSLGAEVATKLAGLGFRVGGWSRTAKSLPGVESFVGDDQLGTLLSRAEILVCLLPLTAATRNILNRRTFYKLPRGAFVINVARGEHLVEEDLLEALDEGQLAGALLDVFRKEPLEAGHPFWAHPQVVVTPHIAGITDPDALAAHIVENYRRLKSGEELLDRVAVRRGY